MDMLKTLSQTLFVRLFAQAPGRGRNQRGASALEYLVLAAVVVLAIGSAAYQFAGEDDNPVTQTFEDLADCMTDGTNC